MSKSEKCKKIFQIVFIIFMILQPLFDIYYLYADSLIGIFKFSPSTIIRMFIMCLLIVTSFLWIKSSKKKKYLIIFSFIFLVYSILHHINSLYFYSPYGNYNYSTLKELFYLVRMSMPLAMIFVTYEKKMSIKQIRLIIVAVSLIFSITMILTNIFEIALTSYNFGNKIIKANIFDWFSKDTYIKYGYEFVASKGIFHMANQVSATLLCLLPLNIYIYISDKKSYNIITISLMIISMLMLGTRVASYGWIIAVFVMIALYIFFEGILSKNKINVREIILLIIVFILGIALFKFSPVKNRFYITDNASIVESGIKKMSLDDSLSDFVKKMTEKEQELNTKGKNEKHTKEKFKSIKEEKIKFIKENYNSFGIDGNFINVLYPYYGDVDFWLEEMAKPFAVRANHRQLKTDITKRVIENNDNKLDYLFGISFSRMRNAQLYMENDIYVHLYSIGIFGIIIFICPYIIILLYALISMIKNKDNFNFKNITLIFSICLIFAAGLVSGNVFDEWIVTLFLGFICGILLQNIKKKNKKKDRVLFIASTGGHLSELLQLNSLFSKYDSYLITEKTKSTINLKEKYSKVNYLVYGTKDHLFIYMFKFLYNCVKSLVLFIKIRPKAIVTTGTHTAVPICYIGKLFRKKIIFIETFANRTSKTLSGKLVYPIADTFIVQWKEMLKLYPKAIYGGWIY